MGLLCDEQKQLQKAGALTMRETIPYFPVTSEYNHIEFAPPVKRKGLIIRLCNSTDEGIILGKAAHDADRILAEYRNTEKNTLFAPITCNVWYTAAFTLTKDESNNIYHWHIGKKYWKKRQNP